MAAPTVITITDAMFMLGDTSADVIPGTGTGDNFSCQVTSASVNSVPNLNDVPATFCAPASQAPAATGYELAITWLQDWTDPAGLSQYAYDNDTLQKFFSLTLEGTTAPIITGELRVVAGPFGGDAGAPLTADAVWPVMGKPDITPATALASRVQPETDSVPANA